LPAKGHVSKRVFEKSIGTLFWLGQFPVMIVTLVALLIIDQIYHSEKNSWFILAATISGILSLIFSIIAYQLRKKGKERLVVFFLYLSLCITLAYIACIMMITSGKQSPFVHLLVYLPAVVFMVAEMRLGPEILSALGCLVCFCLTYKPEISWDPWDNFLLIDKNIHIYDKFFMGLLLTLLILVNHQIEKLANQKNISMTATQKQNEI